MSFLDEIKKRENEKQEKEQEIQNAMPGWAAAVREMFRFILRHVRPDAEAPNQVEATETEIRVSGHQMSRLEISYGRRTITLTPLPLNRLDQWKGGTVQIESSGQMPHRLLWDGESHSVKDHWEIATITSSKEPFTAESFDKLLMHLFGFDR